MAIKVIHEDGHLYVFGSHDLRCIKLTDDEMDYLSRWLGEWCQGELED